MSVAIERMLWQFTVRAGRAAFLQVPETVWSTGAPVGAEGVDGILRPELKSQAVPVCRGLAWAGRRSGSSYPSCVLQERMPVGPRVAKG